MVLSSIDKGPMVVVVVSVAVMVAVALGLAVLVVAVVVVLVVAVVSPGPLKEENPKSRSPVWKIPRLLMRNMVLNPIIKVVSVQI